MRTAVATTSDKGAANRSRRLTLAGAVLASLALVGCGSTTATQRETKATPTTGVETARAQAVTVSTSGPVALPNLDDPAVRSRFAESFADGYFAP